MTSFKDNFNAIFGKDKPVERGSFTQTKDGLVPRGTVATQVNAPMVMAGLPEFQSPIDKTMISSRKQLAEHNKRYGVTNVADYSNGYVEKKAVAREAAGQKYLNDTRRSDINQAIERHS